LNLKPATALLAASILVSGDILLERHDSLVPREHVHAEMQAEPVATTATYLAASGVQTAFDNEAFSPAIPWASVQAQHAFASTRLGQDRQSVVLIAMQVGSIDVASVLDAIERTRRASDL